MYVQFGGKAHARCKLKVDNALVISFMLCGESHIKAHAWLFSKDKAYTVAQSFS